MCKEGKACRSASMDEMENFPYQFESLSRSVSSSSSINGEGGSVETSSRIQDGGTPLNFSSKTPPIIFNEMMGVFNSNSNTAFDGSARAFSFSPVAMMPVRSDSKQSIQDIENLCRSLADCKSTGPVNVTTSISISPTTSVTTAQDHHNVSRVDRRPPGITRMPSFGTEYKPAYLYTPQEELQVESLISLTFDEQNSHDVGLSIDSGASPNALGVVIVDNTNNATLVADAKTTTSSSSYLSMAAEMKARDLQRPNNWKNAAVSSSNASIAQQPQPRSSSGGNGGNSKGWHPDADDIELFDCVVNILKSYTLGIKDIIGLRQILRNKFGDLYVNRFNKKLSSKSLLWRYHENENRLKELVKNRSRKFTLVIKNETSMFYLCAIDNIPDGFSRWVPRSDPNWSVSVVSSATDNSSDKKGAKKQSQKTSKGPQYLDEQSDITLLAQPSWRVGI